jgi:dihydroorotate dehydrogenase electron transfer subunit
MAADERGQEPPCGQSTAVMTPEPVAPASAAQRFAPVLENVAIARDTYRLRLADPLMAQAIMPGQFVMIRPGAEGARDPLLGRPFALYDVARDAVGTPCAFDVVYMVVGRGTAALAQRRPGERLSIWGPLGNGFGPPPGGTVYFVAGGIGQTPFLALGRWWLGKIGYGMAEPLGDPASPVLTPRPFTSSATLFYGVRTAGLLAGVDDFLHAGIAVEIATDDGSAGYHGFVTELLSHWLDQGDRPTRVIGCGPLAMLVALTRLVKRHNIPCDVSLENHMACGFGACFSCVAPIRQPAGTTDFRRVCLEGPVFPVEAVDWSQFNQHGGQDSSSLSPATGRNLLR